MSVTRMEIGSFCTVDTYPGVAFTLRDCDDEGTVTVRMVGDDRDFQFLLDDVEPLDREAFCGGCGQIGCGHDGRQS